MSNPYKTPQHDKRTSSGRRSPREVIVQPSLFLAGLVAGLFTTSLFAFIAQVILQHFGLAGNGRKGLELVALLGIPLLFFIGSLISLSRYMDQALRRWMAFELGFAVGCLGTFAYQFLGGWGGN